MPEAAAPSLAEFIAAWELFRDPVLCGMLAGLGLGILGVYVVLRRMVFVAAALSQAAGLGVALTFLLTMWLNVELPPTLGAVLMCLGATWLFTLRAELLRLSSEAVLAFAWVAAGALAIVVGDRIAAEAHDINAILFGSAVLVRPEDLWSTAGAAALAVTLHLWWGRGLVFAAFDPEVARVHGLPVQALDFTLWVCVALMVSVATRALGALPVFAFSVLPAVAALLSAPSMRWVFPLAAVYGVFAGGAGYLLAFFESLPVGASQTLVAGVTTLVALLVRGLRGGS